MVSVFRNGTEDKRFDGNTGGTIPPSINLAIKQGLFAAEGGSRSEPVIIGRTIQDKSEFYAVISTILRDQDKDLYLYLYILDFFSNNKYKNLCNLAAWLGEQDSIPVWGNSLQNCEIPDISEPIDSSAISDNLTRIEEGKDPFHDSFKKINSRIYIPKPADQNINSVAWAFNVTSLEKPEQFQYICTADQQSCASIAAQLQANGTNNAAIATTTPTKDLLANKPKGRYSLEIHEFSTGIHADGDYNNWISQGFSGTYMNATIDPIPNIVEIAIANGLFQTVGGLPHQPAIIGRVLQGKDEQWSVVAVVTIGKDDGGRSLSAFRYFLAKGVDSISAIVAWLESEKKQRKLTIFNPFEPKRFGGVNKVDIEIPERIQLQEEDLNWLNEPVSSVTGATSQLSLQEIDNLAYVKSQLNQKPISWAYNVYSLKSPDRFQVIHPVNDASRNTILTELLGNQQQPDAMQASDVRLDPKSLLKTLIGQSIPSNNLIADLLGQIRETLTFSDESAKNYWEEVFQSFDAVIILSKRLYLPQNVRLLTWRAIVFPETLPEFVNWICDGDDNQISKNKNTFKDVEEVLSPHFESIKENLILGVIELLIGLSKQGKDEDAANPKSVENVAWLLETNKANNSLANNSLGLWSALRDEVITAFLARVLTSATSGTGSIQPWQSFIQPLLPNETVDRIALAKPVGWCDFYAGIREYTINKQNNPKYVYIAELFEQLGSGQKKNFLSRAKDFISGVSQLFIFIIAIILVNIFDRFFATDIAKETSSLVSMFAPLAGLALVSLVTRSFISAFLVGIPHIIFIRWRLCLDVITDGWAAGIIWTFLILAIWLIYEATQRLKKSNEVNGDAYALASVFYIISNGTVSQNVFDNAVKSKYTSNRKVQGFSIASAKTIDDSLIRFVKKIIRFVKKIQLEQAVVILATVAFICVLILGIHTLRRPSPFAPILSYMSYNPNCPIRGDWETTRKEIQSIVDENIQGGNKPKVISALLDTLGEESLVGNEAEKNKYFYKGAIEEARQDSKLIQDWTELISKYQTSKKRDFSDIPGIIVSGYISRGDRTSQLLRNELTTRLNPQPVPSPTPQPSSTPKPNGTIEIGQREIDAMFREAQQAIGATSEQNSGNQTAIQQRILQAIKELLLPPPPNTTPLQYPIRPNTTDLRDWRYDINRRLTGNPDKSPTAKEWQDFKDEVIQKVRQLR